MERVFDTSANVPTRKCGIYISARRRRVGEGKRADGDGGIFRERIILSAQKTCVHYIIL